jgi:hypothetical protein
MASKFLKKNLVRESDEKSGIQGPPAASRQSAGKARSAKPGCKAALPPSSPARPETRLRSSGKTIQRPIGGRRRARESNMALPYLLRD